MTLPAPSGKRHDELAGFQLRWVAWPVGEVAVVHANDEHMLGCKPLRSLETCAYNLRSIVWRGLFVRHGIFVTLRPKRSDHIANRHAHGRFELCCSARSQTAKTTPGSGSALTTSTTGWFGTADRLLGPSLWTFGLESSFELRASELPAERASVYHRQSGIGNAMCGRNRVGLQRLLTRFGTYLVSCPRFTHSCPAAKMVVGIGATCTSMGRAYIGGKALS